MSAEKVTQMMITITVFMLPISLGLVIVGAAKYIASPEQTPPPPPVEKNTTTINQNQFCFWGCPTSGRDSNNS